MPSNTPHEIKRSYWDKVGPSPLVATCLTGQEFERRKVGFCYDDIIVATRKCPLCGTQGVPVTECHACGPDIKDNFMCSSCLAIHNGIMKHPTFESKLRQIAERIA